MINSVKLYFLRYLPLISRFIYGMKRSREDQNYWSTLETPQAETEMLPEKRGRPRLLIVTPADCDNGGPFEPASGNLHYEIYQSARERYGAEWIEIFHLPKDVDWIDQCRAIVNLTDHREITHMLFHIESREARSKIWRWDILAAELSRMKSNVIAIGFLTDGTYELHQLQCGRFAEIYSRSMFLQIDVEPTSEYVNEGRLVGPTFLPISLESSKQLYQSFLQPDALPDIELSFVGELYGYRQKIVKALLDKGINVVVNPQVSNINGGKASYFEYMNALRRSRHTMNFARANGTRQKQLKSRILESVLVGSIPITDDNGLSVKVLPTAIPLLSFSRLDEILDLIGKRRGNEPSRLGFFQPLLEPASTIRLFAANHFWETLEAGLFEANLQNLTD